MCGFLDSAFSIIISVGGTAAGHSAGKTRIKERRIYHVGNHNIIIFLVSVCEFQALKVKSNGADSPEGDKRRR